PRRAAALARSPGNAPIDDGSGAARNGPVRRLRLHAPPTFPAHPSSAFAIWPSGSYHPAQADGAPRAESALGAAPGLISITSIEAWEMAGARTAPDRLRML